MKELKKVVMKAQQFDNISENLQNIMVLEKNHISLLSQNEVLVSSGYQYNNKHIDE